MVFVNEAYFASSYYCGFDQLNHHHWVESRGSARGAKFAEQTDLVGEHGLESREHTLGVELLQQE